MLSPLQQAVLSAALQIVGLVLVVVALWVFSGTLAGLVALGAALLYIGYTIDLR